MFYPDLSQRGFQQEPLKKSPNFEGSAYPISNQLRQVQEPISWMVGGCLIKEQLHHCGPTSVSRRAYCCRQILSSWLGVTACLGSSDPFQKAQNWLDACQVTIVSTNAPSTNLFDEQVAAWAFFVPPFPLVLPPFSCSPQTRTHTRFRESQGTKKGFRVTVTI